METSIPKNKKGRILRIKKGYNPNSSSMGSIVFILPATLLAVTAGFGVISGIILSFFMKKSCDNSKNAKAEDKI